MYKLISRFFQTHFLLLFIAAIDLISTQQLIVTQLHFTVIFPLSRSTAVETQAR